MKPLSSGCGDSSDSLAWPSLKSTPILYLLAMVRTEVLCLKASTSKWNNASLKPNKRPSLGCRARKEKGSYAVEMQESYTDEGLEAESCEAS